MSAQYKQFNPEGKLVVAKADGMDFGGKHYEMGEEVPNMPFRKKRQLYFQNKLAYDYEIDARRVERAAEARRFRDLSKAAINSPKTQPVRAKAEPSQEDIEREAAIRAQAEEIRAREREAEEAQLARDKAAYEAKFGKVNSTDGEPPVVGEQTVPVTVPEAPTVEATEPEVMASDSTPRRRVVRRPVEQPAA